MARRTQRRLESPSTPAEQAHRRGHMRPGAFKIAGQDPVIDCYAALELLGLETLSSLYYHIKENRLPFLRVGRCYRFDVRELRAWMKGYGSALDLVRAEKRGA